MENTNMETSANSQDVKEVAPCVESTQIEAKVDETLNECDVKCNGDDKSGEIDVVEAKNVEENVDPPSCILSNNNISEVPNTLAQIATDQIGQLNDNVENKNEIMANDEKVDNPDQQNVVDAQSNTNSEAITSQSTNTNDDDVKCENKQSTEDNSTQKIKNQDDWAKRESQLLEKISALQKQQDDNTNKGLQIQLKVKNEENSLLKAKIVNLETELGAVLRKPNAKNKDIVSKIKKQHEELLTKAKGMIFDKTKMIKNQELQIEALTTQVSSLKEVVTITKDLLEIRNLEATHLKERIDVMDLKMKAEKERHNLMTRKMEAGTNLNVQLKKEYETQLKLFKELKERYEEKFRALQTQCNAPQTSNAADQ